MKSIGRTMENGMTELQCPVHGAYEANVVKIGEHRYPGRCPKCVDEERDGEREALRERAVQALRSRANIPLRFMDRTFANYRALGENGIVGRTRAACQSYAENFEARMKRGGGLILCGKPGTGKTHLVCAIADRVIEQGRSVWYTSVANAVRFVKASWDKNSGLTESEAFARFYRPELLIIDEVGLQRGTASELLILAEVLGERYNRCFPTILATNLTLDELSAYIGERAVDRMREGGGAILQLDWESYRPRVEKDEQLHWPSVDPVDYEEILR